MHHFGSPQTPKKNPNLSHFWCPTWNLPMGALWVCEHGGWAQPTPSHTSQMSCAVLCRPLCLAILDGKTIFYVKKQMHIWGFPKSLWSFLPKSHRYSTAKCLIHFLSTGEIMHSYLFIESFSSSIKTQGKPITWHSRLLWEVNEQSLPGFYHLAPRAWWVLRNGGNHEVTHCV